jgi:hypothetical protein
MFQNGIGYCFYCNKKEVCEMNIKLMSETLDQIKKRFSNGEDYGDFEKEDIDWLVEQVGLSIKYREENNELKEELAKYVILFAHTKGLIEGSS